MNLRLAGHVVAVAGAGSGIGLASARVLGGEGCRLALGSRRASQLEATRAELIKAGTDVVSVCADLSTEEGMETLVAEAVSHFGRLDALVVSIGATPLGALPEIDDAGWETALQQKFMGAMRGVRAVVPHLRAGGGGSIVVLAGNASRVGPADLATAAVVNAALEQLVAAAARAYAGDGISVNCVSPGPVRTARYQALLERLAGAEGKIVAPIPDGRLAEPDEVAALIAFLVSPLARHINGTTVVIDGGHAGAT